MEGSIPQQMKAAVLDKYGGPEVLHVATLPVPTPAADEILIRLESAGVGVWDADIRAGEYEIGERKFPKVIGNDGAGEIVAVGARAKRFAPGDRVYAYSMEGGFYAGYATVDQESASKVPIGLSIDRAGALGADGITALRGLEDVLELEKGESLLIFGASGGIGHLAVQLAKREGARVFGVASGEDGVELVRRLGADAAVDGKHGAVAEALRSFAPDGLDAALVLAGGKGLDAALAQMKKGGRVAYPNGVEPEPKAPKGIKVQSYDGEPGSGAFERLDALIAQAPFHLEVRFYELEDAAQAHRDLAKHHLGKLALRMR
jgi:NADPH:quinone reductase-like Zn-dependent oxidoreductase